MAGEKLSSTAARLLMKFPQLVVLITIDRLAFDITIMAKNLQSFDGLSILTCQHHHGTTATAPSRGR